MATRSAQADARRRSAVAAFACTACGCCCFTARADWVPVFGADEERLGALADRYTQRIGERRYMRIEHGRCAALRVDPRDASYRCAIYEHRPDACRWLTPASGECRAQIAEKRAVALVALRRAATGCRAGARPPPLRSTGSASR